MKHIKIIAMVAALFAICGVASAQCVLHTQAANPIKLTINSNEPHIADPGNHIVALNALEPLSLEISSGGTLPPTGFVLLGSTAINCGAFPAAGTNQQVDVNLAVVLDGINPGSGLGSTVFNGLAVTDFTFNAVIPLGSLGVAFQGAYFDPATGFLPVLTTDAGEVSFGTDVITTLTLGDDGDTMHTLASASINFAGGTFTSFFVGSNGYLCFNQAGGGDFTPSFGELAAGFQAGPTATANPGIAWQWSDLNRGSVATWVVTESLTTGDVTLDVTNQNYWSSQDPAGDTSVTFPAGGGVIIDYTNTLVGLTATESVLIGVSDGDDQNGGNDNDLTGGGLDWGSLGGSYSTAGGSAPESVSYTYPANTALNMTQMIIADIGVADWLITII